MRFPPAAAFLILLAAFWLVGRQFGVDAKLGGHLPSTLLSFALLLGPYWAFGFGAGAWLRRKLSSAAARALAPALLTLPYLVFSIPRSQFRWSLLIAMLAVVFAISALLTHARTSRPDWHDWLTLAILGLSVELHFLDAAWPIPGLNGLAKLLLVDAGLYGYLVIRPIDGIGFDLRPRWSDWRIGLREFLYFTPIGLALGLALGFLHVHRTLGNAPLFTAGWLFTIFFIAMPEELFFRGLMLNLLERRAGTRAALIVSSLLFGLAHFNKRAAYFNWRYVILAAIAGIFYGRAWLARRRLLASAITHATVDTVWSIWLR